MIDLCMALNGPLVDVLLPITMSTLLKHNDVSDVYLHVVNKNCRYEVVDYISKLKGFADVTIYHMPEPPTTEIPIIRDVAWTCQWMLDNCGHQDWAFISHFDIECKAGLLDYYRSLIVQEAGQIGSHNTGLVGYRRAAVKTSDVGFYILDDCYVVMDPQEKRWKLRYSKDPRCTDHSFQISGWDVGELLELGLQYKGWKVLVEQEAELQRFRIHNGSGCGRCLDANEFIRIRALSTLHALGLKQIR